MTNALKIKLHFVETHKILCLIYAHQLLRLQRIHKWILSPTEWEWRLTIIFLSHCFLELFELFICVSFLKLLFYMIIGYAYSHRVEGVSISSALFLTLSTCCLIVHKLLQGCLRFDVFLKRTCMLSLRWVVVIPAQKTLFTKSGTHRHHYSFE